MLAACGEPSDPPCVAPFALCGDRCFNLEREENCGACGNACAEGQMCTSAGCVCPPGLTLCDEGCVDLADPANCGACGNACEVGLETCCDGFCASLATSEADCGTCGNPCASDEVCERGRCVLPACPESTGRCGEDRFCTDLTTNDNCVLCGVSCTDGRQCTAGGCECPEPTSFCRGQCRRLDDTENCGVCGRFCEAGLACDGSACRPAFDRASAFAGGGFEAGTLGPYALELVTHSSGEHTLAYTSPGSGSVGDAVEVVRLNASGTTRWTERVSNAELGDMEAEGEGVVLVTDDARLGSISLRRIDAAGRQAPPVTFDPEGAAGLFNPTLGIFRDGRVVIAGELSGGTAVLGGVTLAPDGVGFGSDAFALVVDSAGVPIVGRVFSGRGTTRPILVEVTPNQRVVVAGQAGAGIDLGGGSLGSVNNGFVGRLDASLNHQWSTQLLADDIEGLAIDARNRVYVTGDPRPGGRLRDDLVAIGSFPREGAFLAALSAGGESRWAEAFGASFVDLGGVAVRGDDVVWLVSGSGAARIARIDLPAGRASDGFALVYREDGTFEAAVRIGSPGNQYAFLVGGRTEECLSDLGFGLCGSGVQAAFVARYER